MKKQKIFFAVALIFVAAIIVYSATNGFAGAFKANKTAKIEIGQGMTGAQIIKELKKEDVIISESFFKLFYKITGNGATFKTGTYELSSKMSYNKIIKELTSFNSEGLIKFTVPEGYKTVQVAFLAESLGFCTSEEFLDAIKNKEFKYANEQEDAKLEGYLYPDTYFFQPGADAEDIIDAMTKEFEKIFTEKMQQRAKEMGFSVGEIITLASIVEKEGASQKKEISSVFHNRLKEGKRLESCATVNYLFDTPKDNLSIEDTFIDSEYNTYRNAGLPPTPICSPGLEAIEAALYPADTDYMYFIADGKGGNMFSVTYEEHLLKKGKLQ